MPRKATFVFIFLLVSGWLVTEANAVPSDTSGPQGRWFLNANNYRVIAQITGSSGSYQGTFINEAGGSERLDNISWDPSTRQLEFRRTGNGFWQWYRGTVVEGVLVGRFSHDSQSSARPPITSYQWHATGWNRDYLDQGIFPRVYEVLINREYRGRLRIDASPTAPSGYAGRLKIYSTVSGGASGEDAEYDLEVTRWDGTNVRFLRRNPAWTQVYTGVVDRDRQTISGTFTHPGNPDAPWNGTRAEVLSYGLAGKTPSARADWQVRTRRRLYHLMMAGNPSPATTTVTRINPDAPPISGTPRPDRDDDASSHPQNYRLTQLRFHHTLPNPYGGAALTRDAYAYLAVPTMPPPASGYPVLLAVNGHGGSDDNMMRPNGMYTYGDAFARRGFVVLAVDISHRPLADRPACGGLSPQCADGRTKLYDDSGIDDPAHGHGNHPAVKAPGFDSDWEEDGERAWDAMRGLDYLLSRTDVDRDRVAVIGLSMGGEITTFVGALDPRIKLSIPTGFSPDLGVMLYHGNHTCWIWGHADIRDYIDTSDLHALTAPRPIIVETGKFDGTYSSFAPPFTADKQVARRGRVAYGDDVGNYFHYLHDTVEGSPGYSAHVYRVGGTPNPPYHHERNIRTPAVTAPQPPGSLGWQTDPATQDTGFSVFDFINSNRLTTGTVAGRVTSVCNGTPVGGASIQAYQRVVIGSVTTSVLRGSATTDTAGNYRISSVPWGTYDVFVSAADGFVTPAVVLVDVPAASMGSANFALEGLGAFSGRVTNASSGAPISGATVEVRRLMSLTSIVVIGSATTDATGNYRISGLTRGAFTSIAVSVTGFNPQTRPVDVPCGSTTTENFSMTPLPGVIAGRVTRASDGSPISGASVQARQGSVVRGSATTNAVGDYTIGNLAVGSYEITVSAAGFVPQSRNGVIVNPGATTSAGFSMVVAPGALAGRVTNASDGTPIRGASVQVRQGGILRGSAATNASGNYDVNNLAAGTYDVSISAMGFAGQTRPSMVVNPAATTTVNFSLVALPGVIAGQVTKASDGTPVSSATIQASQGGVARGSATSDASGNYRLDNLSPGVYSLAVRATAYTAQDQAGVSVTAGAISTVNVTLTPMPVSFALTTSLAAGTTPYAITSADFNGDGNADLAVASLGANTVSVRLNAGGGRFGPATDYAAGAGPISINWDDFNSDGNWDLVVANRDSNEISVLLGNGDGTFQPAVNYPTGPQPIYVASADFNGDGFSDIITVNRGSNTVSLLLGNGDGTFGSAMDFGTGAAPSSAVIGDFNSDGFYDLAVANRDSGTISILLGDGQGSFTPGTGLTTGSLPVSILLDDFNGDQIMDLATANSGSNNLSVFLGNGDGTFAAAGTFGTGASPFSVASGDFNGDGREDLAVADSGSGEVSVLLGNGDGTFAPALTFSTGGQQPLALVSADLDGDGKLDLAVVNSGSNTVSILINNTVR